MADTYKVINNNKGTNWIVGAIIRKISFWEGEFAAFTDHENPGACIHAHSSEVEEIELAECCGAEMEHCECFEDDSEGWPHDCHDLSDDADALASAGWGCDEDYGCYGGDEY